MCMLRNAIEETIFVRRFIFLYLTHFLNVVSEENRNDRLILKETDRLSMATMNLRRAANPGDNKSSGDRRAETLSPDLGEFGRPTLGQGGRERTQGLKKIILTLCLNFKPRYLKLPFSKHFYLTQVQMFSQDCSVCKH